MQTEHLYYLTEIASHGSINKAAEALHLPRTHLSRIVARLEGELDIQIFERLQRGVRPTEAGDYLLAQAEKILAIWSETVVHLHEERSKILTQYHDRLTFFCPSHGRSRRQMSGVLEAFQEEFVNVQVIQRAVPSPLPLDQLAATPNMLALVMRAESIPELRWELPETLTFIPLAETSLVALVGAGHGLAENRSVSLKTLCGEDLLLVINESSELPYFYELLSAYGKPNVKQCVSGNIPLLQELLQSGRYATLGLASNHVEDGLLQIPLREKLTITIGLLYNQEVLSVVPLRALANRVLALFDKRPLEV